MKKILIPININLIINEYKISIKNPDGSISYETKYITNPAPNLKYNQIKAEYQNLIKKYQDPMKNEDSEFIGGLPVQLEKECIKNLLQVDHKGNYVYQMTLKVDGERFLLFLGRDGIIYFIDRSVNFYKFVNDDDTDLIFLNPEIVKPFLFDGELVYHKKENIYEFLIFDCLFYQNEMYINKNYSERYNVCDYALNNVFKKYFKEATKFNLFCSLKIWFSINAISKVKDIYKFISTTTNELRRNKFKLISDGIILQPFDQSYVPFGPWNRYRNIQFKWKPSDQLTLDFKIKVFGENEWHLLTKTDQEYAVKQPDGENVPAICIPTDKQKKIYFENDVVEFNLKKTMNPQKNIFIPLRARPEKEANGYQTIMSTLNVINNPFTLDFNFNNTLNLYSKSDLILCMISNFFTKYEIKQINKIYEKYINYDSENLELEFRIFKYGKKGKNVDKFTFYYLYDYLKNKDPVYSETIDIIDEKFKHRSTYHSLKDVPTNVISNQHKEKIVNYTLEPTQKELYNNLTFKLELSDEKKINKVIGFKSLFAGQMKNNYIRIKKRHSFNFNLWRIDLTKVLSAYTPDTLKDKNESFEIECEYTGGKTIPFDIFIESMSDIYKIILNNSNYC